MATNDVHRSLGQLSDVDLILETKRLAAREREATVEVIAALMELDERKLYLGQGCASLFANCTEVLRFSEYAAYSRIEAARVARRVPHILDLLTEGALTLTAVGLLAPHLTQENVSELLAAARHKSKREVERIVAGLRPLPIAPSTLRKLPVPAPTAQAIAAPSPTDHTDPAHSKNPVAGFAPPSTVPAPRAIVVPLAPERYKMQITISREAHDTLRRAQDLLRHVIPSGDPAAIVERALSRLVEDLERRKLAAVRHPHQAGTVKPGSRHVPAAVRREVWTRDEGRCAFVGTEGRCTERGFLEFHHVIPFADGGTTDAVNLQLRCRAHNAFEADKWFGPMQVKETAAVFRTGSGPSVPVHF